MFSYQYTKREGGVCECAECNIIQMFCLRHDGDVCTCALCMYVEDSETTTLKKTFEFFLLKYRSLMLIESLHLIFVYNVHVNACGGELAKTYIYIYTILA